MCPSAAHFGPRHGSRCLKTNQIHCASRTVAADCPRPMAPKNSASTRNHWAATADTKTDSPLMATGIDDEFEIWNGTALTKAVWFFQHLRLLPERRKAFVQLCRTGTAYTDKGSKIAVYHPEGSWCARPRSTSSTRGRRARRMVSDHPADGGLIAARALSATTG